jgi:hypothetical protein
VAVGEAGEFGVDVHVCVSVVDIEYKPFQKTRKQKSAYLQKYLILRNCACMTIIRFIMPTHRNTEAQQRRATDHLEPDLTIVRDVDELLRQLRPGRTVTIDHVKTFARKTSDRIDIVRKIFAAGCDIVTASGAKLTPDQEDIVVELMTANKRALSAKEASRRGGWNKVDDADREKALKFWKDDELSVEQLVEYTGYSYSTLRNWFAAEHPRKDKRGRPRKRKN